MNINRNQYEYKFILIFKILYGFYAKGHLLSAHLELKITKSSKPD